MPSLTPVVTSLAPPALHTELTGKFASARTKLKDRICLSEAFYFLIPPTECDQIYVSPQVGFNHKDLLLENSNGSKRETIFVLLPKSSCSLLLLIVTKEWLTFGPIFSRKKIGPANYDFLSTLYGKTIVHKIKQNL